MMHAHLENIQHYLAISLLHQSKLVPSLDYFRSSDTHRKIVIRKASGNSKNENISTRSSLHRNPRKISHHSKKQLSYNDAINDGAFTTNLRSAVSVFKSYHKMLTKLWKPSVRWKSSLFSVDIFYNPLPDNYLGIVLTTGDIVRVSSPLLSRWFRTNCALR